MRVRSIGAKPRERGVWRLPIGSGEPVYAFNDTLDNLIHGVRERVFLVASKEGPVPPPRPTHKIADILDDFKGKLLRSAQHLDPYTHEEFVAGYTGGKRLVYERALASLKGRPIDKRDGRCKRFVKFEKRLKYSAAPRIISARSPRYNIALGVFIKRAEPVIYEAINHVFGYPVVIKGVDSSAAGKMVADSWFSIGDDAMAFGLDAHRYDQHINLQALRWEHSVYQAIFKAYPELARLLKMQEHNVGVGVARDGIVAYNVEATRSSGDMNTSLGNTLLMCALLHAFIADNKIRARVVNNGDDSVIMCRRKDYDAFEALPAYFTRYGFTMVLEKPVRVLERVEFCQARPLWADGGWRLVRTHNAVFSKDSTSTKDLRDPCVYDAWRYAVGKAGVAVACGVPCQQEFYLAMQRGARPGKCELDRHSGLGWLSGALPSDPKPVTWQARISYTLAFGITPDQQMAMEASLSTITPKHPLDSPQRVKPTRFAIPAHVTLPTNHLYFPQTT